MGRKRPGPKAGLRSQRARLPGNHRVEGLGRGIRVQRTGFRVQSTGFGVQDRPRVCWDVALMVAGEFTPLSTQTYSF